MTARSIALAGTAALALGVGACTAGSGPHSATQARAGEAAEISPLQKQLAALAPARALPESDSQKQLAAALDAYFQRTASQRLYVGVDKPLYQPGEDIWFRVWELATPTLMASTEPHGITVELVNPQGATVLQKRLLAQGGQAMNDFSLPPEIAGGEYLLRASSDRGGSGERSVILSTYQPPRLKKSLEFLRKAYGPGDAVSAAIKLERGTGEPLARAAATALVSVDGAEVARLPITTDEAGKAVVRFQLPDRIQREDGLLTVLVADAGVTESVQKRIPLLLKELRFELYPEGGELVSGLPGRVYFAARNTIDKPADVEGRVVDDRGKQVATLRSLHNGMGRFELEPAPGRSYQVRITRPEGIAATFPLPPARDKGCVLHAVDDFTSARDDVRVAVFCSDSRTVIATAALRERRLGDLAAQVTARQPSVLSLPVPRGSQGAVRVTVFDDALDPLAERLIYRGRGHDLNVAIGATRRSYAPRDKVELAVTTTDASGRPVAADLAVAVVDDTVLSYADDKTGHMLARIYLESEMPGQEIEEPNFYFSRDPKAPRAIDLVLGTQGWRRFVWTQVLQPPVPETPVAYEGAAGGMPPEAAAEAEAAIPAAAPMPAPPPGRAAQAPMARAAGKGAAMKKEAAAPEEAKMAAPRRAAPMPAQAVPADGMMRRARRPAGIAADEMARAERDDRAVGWAPVREFPAPSHQGRLDGPRSDFRETVYWLPSLKTDARGRATTSFYLSDAITSFRVTAEGLTRGGLPGRGEALVQSKLPVSLAARLPVEVASGDSIRLPVTLSNETQRSYQASLQARFGPAFRVQSELPPTVNLGPGERKSYFVDLSVVGAGRVSDEGAVLLTASAAQLTDEVKQTIRVVPLGFPQELSAAGTLERKASHEVDLAGALPGSLDAVVTLYPSPLATMTKGVEAIVREPYGCFEQASSANYPNVMVLGYLQEHEAADADLVARTHTMLDRGYKMLTGYESPKRGYEWFGGDPGHEALTAYGLMEFMDMAKVYDVDRGMIDRTARWLESRRDGKGGFQRNPRALDSFGAASPEVTNAYITYALGEAGRRDLDAELAVQRRLAGTTRDPYLLALATNTLLNLEPQASGSAAAVDRLAGLQDKDGAFRGANHSITRSGGTALEIETTALAALALLKAGPAQLGRARSAIDWLNQKRDGWGGYGSTQSTILALRAMTRYAAASRATTKPGVVRIRVNGKPVGELAFAAGHRDPLVFSDAQSALVPGKNLVELELEDGAPMPYSIALTWRSKQPASSPKAPVHVQSRLEQAQVKLGESVRLHVAVQNTSAQGQPMTLARVGIPGGLSLQTWQLKELVDKKLVDFFETGPREAVLYFRSLPPNATRALELDLLAAVPGRYIAPASRAYLYYTDELVHWIEPVSVAVLQK